MGATPTIPWKVASLVKVQDLGYKSSNLQDLPNKEEKRKNQVETAMANLTSVEPPESLHPRLPNSLFEGSKEQ